MTSSPDADDVHRFALALPYVAEIESDGFDFRGGRQGDSLALPRAQTGQVAAHPDRQRGAVRRLRGREAVVPGEREVFFTTAGYDGSPLAMPLAEQVDVERVGEP